MARKKIKTKTVSKGRKNLKAKAQASTGKKRGRKPTKKIPVGFTLLKRDENALLKSYELMEKSFDSFSEMLNSFCYENGDKIKAATQANKSLVDFTKKTIAFKKTLLKSKRSLKPVYAEEVKEIKS